MERFLTHDRGVEVLEDTLAFMLDLVEKRKKDSIDDQLILVQHPSVFTVGRGNQRVKPKVPESKMPGLPEGATVPGFHLAPPGGDLVMNPAGGLDGLSCSGSTFDKPLLLTRGGGITFHDQGQVVGYPIVKLSPDDGFGIDRYLRTLERYLIAVLQSFDSTLNFTTDPRGTGIWLQGKKVASIGIAISGWVTYHGFAINLNADLTQFHKINPCGMNPEVIANVSDFTRATITVEKLKEKLKDTFRHFFEETAHGKESFGTKNQDLASTSGRIA